MSKKNLAIVLAEDIYEDLELHYPRLRMLEAGMDVRVAGPEKGVTYTSKHGYPTKTDVTFADVAVHEVAILVVPGGYAPDRLRRHETCINLVKDVWAAGGVVGAICHAGWVLASADIVQGRQLTSVPAIRVDMENAGAVWVNERCVVDGKLVTAQSPDDLPQFTKALLHAHADG